MPRWPGMTTCSATSTTTGKRCGRAPAPGSDKCVFHGAGAPQVKAAAQRRLADAKVRELAEQLDVEVPEFATGAEAARYVLGRVTKRAAQFGQLADDYGASLTYSDAIGVERLRAAVIGEQKWLENLTRVLGVLAQAEAARGNQGADEMRAAIVGDVAWAARHAVVTTAARSGRFPGAELAEFTDETMREIRRVCRWAIRTGAGRSAKYEPAGDDEPLAITAGDG